MKKTMQSLCSGVFALALAAVLPSQAEAGQWWPRFQNVPPVVAQAGIVTGTPSAQPCPQGAGLGDGCPMSSIGNGVGTVQHADFFTGYAAQTSIPQTVPAVVAAIGTRKPHVIRPDFNVPGVDYPVGVPSSTTLKEVVANAASLPKGCTLYGSSPGTYNVVCLGLNAGSALVDPANAGLPTNSTAATVYTRLTFDGWDFATNSVPLTLGQWKGEFNFINGTVGGTTPSTIGAKAAWWVLSLTTTAADVGSYPGAISCVGRPDGCFHFYNDNIDGNVLGNVNGAGTQYWGKDLIQLNQGMTVAYNAMTNAYGRFIVTGINRTPSLGDYCTFANNYVEGFINPNKPPSPHNEIALLSGPCGHQIYRYNAMMQPTKNGDTNLTASSPAGAQNGFDITAFVFPGVVLEAICPSVTFTGYTGTVSSAGCGTTTSGNEGDPFVAGKDGAHQSTPLTANTTLVVTDGSGTVINGHVTKINNKGPADWDGAQIASFTMDAENELPTGVSLRVQDKMPEFRVDHNVMVANMWNSGSTEFGYLIGGLKNYTVGVLQIEENYMDLTGASGCYQSAGQNPTVGAEGIPAVAARSQVVLNSGDYDLRTGTKITSFSSLTDPCTKGYNIKPPGYTSQYGQP